jgi:hypothetical protein
MNYEKENFYTYILKYMNSFKKRYNTILNESTNCHTCYHRGIYSKKDMEELYKPSKRRV